MAAARDPVSVWCRSNRASASRAEPRRSDLQPFEQVSAIEGKRSLPARGGRLSDRLPELEGVDLDTGMIERDAVAVLDEHGRELRGERAPQGDHPLPQAVARQAVRRVAP